MDGDYRYPDIKIDVPMLSEDALHLYMEICQHDYVRSYNYYCGQAYPKIMMVCRVRGTYFNIDVAPGYAQTIGTLMRVQRMFDMGWQSRTKILEGDIAKELLAKAEPETSQVKQL